MIKKNCITALAFAGALTTTVVASAEDKAGQAAVDFRESAMTIYKWYLGPMGAMVKGKVPFDQAAFRQHAEGLATAAQLDLLPGFPEGSDKDTEARPEIWERWSDFQARYRELQEQSGKLAQIAATGDEAAMKAQFGETANTCKGCHDDFREK